MVSSLIEAIVSVRRLSRFLRAGELQHDAIVKVEKGSLSYGDEILSIKGGEFSWTKDSMPSTLEGIDLKVCKGELVGVLGRVGAGKVFFLVVCITDVLLIASFVPLEQLIILYHW